MNTNPVDFSILVSSTVDQMDLLAHEKSLSLICDAPPGVMVDANEVRLRQVVVNLLDNAIKYTPEGGKISVMVRASLDEAIMEIADDGIGISVEALPHVFERFYRSEQVQTHRVRGTGLGLSMDTFHPGSAPWWSHGGESRERWINLSSAIAATGSQHRASNAATFEIGLSRLPDEAFLIIRSDFSHAGGSY